MSEVIFRSIKTVGKVFQGRVSSGISKGLRSIAPYNIGRFMIGIRDYNTIAFNKDFMNKDPKKLYDYYKSKGVDSNNLVTNNIPKYNTTITIALYIKAFNEAFNEAFEAGDSKSLYQELQDYNKTLTKKTLTKKTLTKKKKFIAKQIGLITQNLNDVKTIYIPNLEIFKLHSVYSTYPHVQQALVLKICNTIDDTSLRITQLYNYVSNDVKNSEKNNDTESVLDISQTIKNSDTNINKEPVLDIFEKFFHKEEMKKFYDINYQMRNYVILDHLDPKKTEFPVSEHSTRLESIEIKNMPKDESPILQYYENLMQNLIAISKCKDILYLREIKRLSSKRDDNNQLDLFKILATTGKLNEYKQLHKYNLLNEHTNFFNDDQKLDIITLDNLEAYETSFKKLQKSKEYNDVYGSKANNIRNFIMHKGQFSYLEKLFSICTEVDSCTYLDPEKKVLYIERMVGAKNINETIDEINKDLKESKNKINKIKDKDLKEFEKEINTVKNYIETISEDKGKIQSVKKKISKEIQKLLKETPIKSIESETETLPLDLDDRKKHAMDKSESDNDIKHKQTPKHDGPDHNSSNGGPNGGTRSH